MQIVDYASVGSTTKAGVIVYEETSQHHDMKYKRSPRRLTMLILDRGAAERKSKALTFPSKRWSW